jgi:hypothetical protein
MQGHGNAAQQNGWGQLLSSGRAGNGGLLRRQVAVMLRALLHHRPPFKAADVHILTA